MIVELSRFVGTRRIEPHGFAVPWISLRCTNSPRGPSSNPASIKPRALQGQKVNLQGLVGLLPSYRLPMPEMPAPQPFVANAPESVALSGFGAAIVACGYRPDYKSCVRLPEVFDAMGLPIQEDGCSTVVPGLNVMGMPFQRKRTSATLFGVGEDAQTLAERMAAARVTT
jgi:hypothetical protein